MRPVSAVRCPRFPFRRSARPSRRRASTLVGAVALVVLLGLAGPAPVRAEAIGPLCWELGFSEQYFSLVFFVDPAHDDMSTVVGKILPSAYTALSSPVSGSAHAAAGPSGPEVHMVLTVGSWLLFDHLVLNIVFNLSDLKGFGICEQSAYEFPCDGKRASVTWNPVTCPG